MLESPTNTQYLVRRVQAMIKQAYPKEQNLDLDDHHIENVLMWAAKRLTFLQDLTDSKLSFLWVRPNDFKLKYITHEQMQSLIEHLACAQFTKDKLNGKLKKFADKNQLKFATFMKTLRSVLSGLKEGPGVAEMMNILSSEAVLQRLKSCINKQREQADQKQQRNNEI
ncbi:nondiscriminating glutamyl-tRNA synthetase EARS2, mitochondrial-like isoform X2 [Eurosta solidaginis]|uniref:nondiscriminating glutamyl-tRNA synthetase EARS2, mitochondrial-like isoform X2 n=1 Tax=Eurosta solidaginis TaxID=178769 RepID=UPI003530AA80